MGNETFYAAGIIILALLPSVAMLIIMWRDKNWP